MSQQHEAVIRPEMLAKVMVSLHNQLRLFVAATRSDCIFFAASVFDRPLSNCDARGLASTWAAERKWLVYDQSFDFHQWPASHRDRGSEVDTNGMLMDVQKFAIKTKRTHGKKEEP